ncbi:glycoside hydrolase family 127 protein [Caldalkalibacillus uzonensis]|nr:beta-L-arabinofuranosidase domain-containing protein [Caldalkalibacillus uzonensis]
MKPISLKDVQINDSFWSKRQRVVRETVIPYQWDALNDNIPGAEKSHTIENFRIAAGETEGQFYGMVFQDSDLAKWLEAVAYVLVHQRDEDLEKLADEVIDLLERAQQPDGYLNTYFTVKKPEGRWTNLRDDHELYCAGHLIEAAVAYDEATGKRKFLDIICRYADYIASVFGTEPGKIRGYDGHPEIELALVKLYKATGQRKYLELSKYFVEERGRQPHFFDQEAERRGEKEWFISHEYYQAHLPVRQQKTAEGHAVRAVYLFSAMADLAAEYGDQRLFDVCKTLWNNVTRKRMYITGGIGSSHYLERFTVDYDLPNDRSYAETCAAIGLVFWAHRMLQIEADSQYADVIERALYNGILSGISLDGKSYFYVNPLEVWPATANHRHDMKSVKITRQPWFGCACCPPNIARLLASLGQYLYSQCEPLKQIFVHQYISSEAEAEINGERVKLVQSSGFPWDGQVKLVISQNKPLKWTLALRLPAWSARTEVKINGEKLQTQGKTAKGYLYIERMWQPGDSLEVFFAMEIQRMRAHPEVRANAGKVALQRGPVVFCLEEADNGQNLQDIVLPEAAKLAGQFDATLLEGVYVIKGWGVRTDMEGIGDELYSPQAVSKVPIEIKAIPYYAWSNRDAGEMLVWIREY